MEIKHLSPSSINTFNMCNYAYKLRYKYGLKGFPNLGSHKGKICHSVLEHILKMKMDGADFTEKDIENKLLTVFNSEFSSNNGKYLLSTIPNFNRDLEIEDCRELIYKAINSKLNFFNKKIIGVEKKVDLIISSDGTLLYDGFGEAFSNKETGKLDEGIDICKIFGRFAFRIYGIIDLLIEQDSNTIEIVDWKTGKNASSFKALQKDIQALMYSLAIRYLYPEYSNYMVTMCYLRKKSVVLCFNNLDMIKTTNMLYSIWRKITNGKKMGRTIKGYNKKWKCNYCSFKNGKEDCDIFFMLDSLGKPLDKAIQYAKNGRSLETLI